MTIVSSVLVTRLWAVYDRDRRVLALIVTAFLCIFIPTWIISFRGFAHNLQQRDLDTLMYNYAYLGMAKAMGQREVDKVWPLTRCFLPHYPSQYPFVILASLCFESSVFTAMAYKMIQDKKKTRLIEAFYRDHGDPIVDGREEDPFAPEGAAKLGNMDSSAGVVSTIINFARLEAMGGPGGDEPENFSHVDRRRHHGRTRDQEAAIPLDTVETLDHGGTGVKLPKWSTGEEEKYGPSTSGVQSFVASSTSTPDSEPSVDWTDLPAPRPRRSGLEDHGRRRRRTSLDFNRRSAGGHRGSERPLEEVGERGRPKSMDERTTAVVSQGGAYLPSGRMSLQGSSATHLELDELTLAGSREPGRPSPSRRSDERGEEDPSSRILHGNSPRPQGRVHGSRSSQSSTDDSQNGLGRPKPTVAAAGAG
ncbi:hypothetical protein FRC04_001126 [Tulasnella sp. 424]|nr:hypothetical protein FRC04_001126 [Tulasnella sp. 424]